MPVQTLTFRPLGLPRTLLKSNFFRPSFSPDSSIHLYSISSAPEIDDENHWLRGRLCNNTKDQLQALIGGFIVSGSNLFSMRRHTELIALQTHDGKFGGDRGSPYELRVEYSHPIPLGMEGQKQTLMVLNVILKRALKEMGLKQVTRYPKFYDQTKTKVFPNAELEVWRGYSAVVNLYESHPLLNVDFSSKIIHTSSLLRELSHLERAALDREIYISTAKQQFEGRIVMTKYKNRRCYRIDELIFDMSPTDTFLRNGVAVTFIDYYRTQYQLRVEDNHQPLIKSVLGREAPRDIYLLPELVTLTGLDDSQISNFSLMRDLATATRLEAKDRLGVSTYLATKLNTNAQVAAFLQMYSLNFNPEPLKVESCRLPGETIKTRTQTSNINETGKLFIQGDILDPRRLDNWVILSVVQEDAAQYGELLITAFRRIGVRAEPPTVDLYDRRTFERTMGHLAESRCQIVVILLPSSRKHEYESIKRVSTTVSAVPTQVILFPVKKAINSLVEKVALQIQAKVGGELWRIPLKPVFGEHLMVIGIDVFHDSVNRRKSVAGFCATINDNLTKYYNTVSIQDSGQEIMTTMGALFKEALHEYQRINGTFPDYVIFFRDGVAESQLGAVRTFEVEPVLEVCRSTMVGGHSYNPNLIYTVVVKKTGAKFFAPVKKGDEIIPSNPQPGTLITAQVVPETGDFYLLSHYVAPGQGIASPCLYKTVYATQSNAFPLEDLARLAYQLCHLYYNWTGAIKVPAPCMMAHKLAELVGKCVHERPSTVLNKLPFYL